MRIDVIHRIGIDAGILQSYLHAAFRAFAAFGGHGHVISVTAHAVTGHLGVNVCAAFFRVFIFFQHHHTGAITEYETIAFGIPGTTGGLRIIITAGQGARRCKAAQRHRTGGFFSAAGNHHIGIAVFDDSCRIADAVGRRCTGRHQCDVRAFHAVHDRQIARDHINDVAGNKERRDSARATLEIGVVTFLDAGQSANAGANSDADTLGIVIGDFQSSIVNRFFCRGQTIMDKGIHFFGFLGGKHRAHIKVFHHAAKARGKFRRIKFGDHADPAFAGQNIFPGGFYIKPDGRDHAHPRYYHTTLCHLPLIRIG